MKNFHSSTSQDRTGQDRTGQDRTGQLNISIPIFQRLYDFYKLLYQYIKLFPKKDRYSLGQNIENTTLEIFEYFFQITHLSGQEKLFLLQKTSNKLDILKILIRLAKDVQAIDNKKYLQLEQLLQEVGKMLGGWLKAAKQSI